MGTLSSVGAVLQDDGILLSTAVDCGALPQPVFGQVDHTEGTTFGQTAIYYCDFGNPIGNSTRTCQATGNWTGSQPTCPLCMLFTIWDKPE